MGEIETRAQKTDLTDTYSTLADGRSCSLHYTVVRLITLDCTGGLSTRYPTADSTVD